VYVKRPLALPAASFGLRLGLVGAGTHRPPVVFLHMPLFHTVTKWTWVGSLLSPTGVIGEIQITTLLVILLKYSSLVVPSDVKS